MYVQVSKTFAAFINKTAKQKGFQARATVVELTERQYQIHVNLWGPASDRDYNWTTGKYKVIAVEYPGEYYAPVRYLSTDELISEARAAGVHDIASCQDMIYTLLAI